MSQYDFLDVTRWIEAIKASDDPREFYYDFFIAIQLECDYLTDEQKVSRIMAMLTVLNAMIAKG